MPSLLHTNSLQVDEATLKRYLEDLGRDRFAGVRYNLLEHNCNNFTEVVCRYLTGNGLPTHILDLPRKFMESPAFATFK